MRFIILIKGHKIITQPITSLLMTVRGEQMNPDSISLMIVFNSVSQTCPAVFGWLFTRLTSPSVLPLSRPDGPRPARRPGLSVPARGHQAGVPPPPCWSLCPADQ